MALLVLGLLMGMRMAPELRPQGPDQKCTHAMLKTEGVGCLILGLKAKMAVAYSNRCAFLSKCLKEQTEVLGPSDELKS